MKGKEGDKRLAVPRAARLEHSARSGPGELDEGLRLLNLFCSYTSLLARSAKRADAPDGPGELREVEITSAIELFEETVRGMNCTRDELLTLWAVFECASRAVSNITHEARLAEYKSM